MKVGINARPLDGPWGGGNRFVQAFASALSDRGHVPTFALDADVDVILIVDPRSRNPQVTFTPRQVLTRLRQKPETTVIHRVNECDERKGTRTMNARLRLANYGADHTVFIASWLQNLAVWRRETPASIILNGADPRVFRRDTARIWNPEEPLRIVTHHWGAHANKGWDVYREIDALVGAPAWRGRIEFTFIGNAPAELTLSNSTLLAPLDGSRLATALAQHHIYLTASVNEPAGMHHIEGALVGLPLIYRTSGALPEYCSGFGEPFTGTRDIAAAVSRMLTNYGKWKDAIRQYPHTSDRMTGRYIDLCESLYEQRASIAARRHLWRNPLIPVMLCLPL
jgi:hypothetical protein